MNPAEWSRIYTPAIQADLARKVHILAPVLTAEESLTRPDLLGQMDILLSGWGAPSFNQQFLKMAPNLRAFFYGAGAVGHLLTEAFLKRQIAVTTANSINAIPVAEFSVAHILLGLKRAWQQALEAKRRRAFFLPQLPVAGAYKSTVGLISLSTIGRQVLQRLNSFDIEVIAYDPTIEEQEATRLGVDLVSLEEVFACSDVVSLHAPLIPETVGMITGPLLESMKPGATFINTARGSIVCEQEMIMVLRSRPDLTAILDVTDPEPPLPTCELFDLPNAVVTPHIAGSLDGECERMGRWIVDEVERYIAGRPLLGLVQTGQALVPPPMADIVAVPR
jgi:phosphoglycerate dehydrogenase-like enzyme